MKKDILYHPTICPVRDTYQIMVPVGCEMFLSVKIGENEYFNHVNGIRISEAPIQRITVPMDELDKAKKYTLVCRKVIERKPYFTETEEAYELEYNFRPVEKTSGIEIYQVADVHGWADNAIAAAQLLKKDYDILLINGDIVHQGYAFYGGNLDYNTEFDLENDCNVEFEISYYKGACVKVFVDGKDCGNIVCPPYRLKVDDLKAGKHKVTCRLYGNRFNTFSALHSLISDEHHVYTGPMYWSSSGDRWAYEYQTRPMGILKAPIIRVSK